MQGRTPRTGRTLPSSPSSPISTTPPSGASGSSPAPASTVTATARSKDDPNFGSDAGSRLTVMRRFGHVSPELTSAARTRSRASCSAVSGSPTRLRPGSPDGQVGLDLDEVTFEAERARWRTPSRTTSARRPNADHRHRTAHQNAPLRCSTSAAPTGCGRTQTRSKRISVGRTSDWASQIAASRRSRVCFT